MTELGSLAAVRIPVGCLDGSLLSMQAPGRRQVVTGQALPAVPEVAIEPGHARDHDAVITFGSFRLLPRERLLLEGDKAVRLGSRALEILIALVERPGELLSKRELMKIVWPDTVVVEANLTVHVTALRRVLRDGQAGNRYIVNIPGRGYRFVAPVSVADTPGSLAPPRVIARPHNLPTRLTPLIGRAEEAGALVRGLSAHRLLTIVGPAGTGKTAVALNAAEQCLPAYQDGVWRIDLGPITDPRLVPMAVAAALTVGARVDNNPLPCLIAALKDKEMLLVLDNCEHVIEAAATLAAEVLRGSRSVQILATSREPLRVEGEHVHRLATLESPGVSDRLDAAAALGFPAVELFVRCAVAAMSDFVLIDEDAPAVGEICRKLDGIPLAIEFAAAQVHTFGVRGLAARLDDRLRLLTGGRRAAQPRHRTMSAALDWSYQLLSQGEQRVFRRLAVAAGSFTLESARSLAAAADCSAADIADSVARLVMKSLVMVDSSDGDARFRLLETTRAYALQKLWEAGEVDALGRHQSSLPGAVMRRDGARSRLNAATRRVA